MLFSLPVLMYHSISNFQHKLCIPPELFERQCAILYEHDWRGISLPEAEAYFFKKKRLPAKTCLLTFDDGYLDNYVHAEPILHRYGHHGVIFPVAEFISDAAAPRPNIENPASKSLLPTLDQREITQRSGLPVYDINFCNWAEIKYMHERSMAAAPHSLSHGRVVRSLKFNKLYIPPRLNGFFAPPPHNILWGLPAFDLGHALSCRAYKLSPKLFDLIEKLVPQELEAAANFLAVPENKRKIIQNIAKIPQLGELETGEEYRKRIFTELCTCRDIFKEKLGTQPESFCWPWGSYNKIALEEGKKAGFKFFFTTTRGANRYGTKEINRIAIRPWHKAEDLLHIVQQSSNALREILYKLAAPYYKTYIQKKRNK